MTEFLGEAHAGCHSYRTNIDFTWLPNLRYSRFVSDVTAGVSLCSTVTSCRHVLQRLEVVDSWNKCYARLLCDLSVVFYIPVISLILRV